MVSPNPGAPALAPQAPLPTGAPARRGLRIAILVVVLLAIIIAVVSTAPSTISNAAHMSYPKPLLGTIAISGGSGNNIPLNQVVGFSVQVQAGRDLSYHWDFGDGSTSEDANPTHSYNQFTTGLTVSVMVTDPLGQQATAALQQVTVLPPPPTASFVITDQSCDPFSGSCAVFVDGSQSQGGTQGVQIMSYGWSWGDGSSDQPSDNPFGQHQYTQSGMYTITLTVTDQFNQSNSTQQTVMLTSPVMASFVIVSSSCDQNSQTCTVSVDASNSTGQGTLTYNWTWGDGSSSQTATPIAQHVYTYQLGVSYVITLTVTDSTGQTSAPYQQSVSF